MSDSFLSLQNNSLELTAIIVAFVVIISWASCFIYIIRFLKQQRNAPHRRPGDQTEIADFTAMKTAIGQPGRRGNNTSADDYTQAGGTTYGMSTTVAGGATTIVTMTELSIPGFLNVVNGVDFKMDKVIARGGAGIIYLATALSTAVLQRTQGQEIVAKGFGETLAAMDDDYKNAFFQELSLMWRFRNHEGFARVFGYSETPAIILMKFYQFGSMADFIHGAGNVSNAYYYSKRGAVRLAWFLCQSLEVMHSAGYVHSDIKPGNVLLDTDSNGGLITVLSDFGICQIVDPTVLRVKAFRVSQAIGASLSYAAPEVLMFLKSPIPLNADENLKKTDIYSLACVMYELFTRRVPWR